MRFKIKHAIRFDRNELAGAFGDIGTDLPLIMGMLAAGQLHAASVLIMFGASQIFTGLWYGMPMPVQPLKVMATLVIAHHISGSVLYTAGLTIGVIMLFLSCTRTIDFVARLVPKAVVRGIQFGLGLKLALVAATDFIMRDGSQGYALAALAFFLVVGLMKNRRWPAALVVIALGALYALAFQKIDMGNFVVELSFPKVNRLSWADVAVGFYVLVLPQLPLSLGNSVLATTQLANDLYPRRKISAGRIGVSYGLINIINSFFSGIPVCHGSGGMAGHYAFGGRTGGSVILYGLMYLITGLLFSGSFARFVQIFPFPVLGVILFFEGLALMTLVLDLSEDRENIMVALMVGILANALPYGFLVGLVIGTVTYYGWKMAARRAQ